MQAVFNVQSQRLKRNLGELRSKKCEGFLYGCSVVENMSDSYRQYLKPATVQGPADTNILGRATVVASSPKFKLVLTMAPCKRKQSNRPMPIRFHRTGGPLGEEAARWERGPLLHQIN